ncbi:MAG: AAA family ATPase [Pseudomonadota bacterium]
MATQKCIITGGPGSGKTSLIEALTLRGHAHLPEVSRRLIREQRAIEDGVLPWRSLTAFAALAVEAMLRDHDLAERQAGIVFFDRGLPDVFGYLRNSGLEIPDRWKRAHDRCTYAQQVFILPPWPEIYVNDDERPQTLDESRALHAEISRAYEQLGYELIEVPKIRVDQRADFVLEQLCST